MIYDFFSHFLLFLVFLLYLSPSFYFFYSVFDGLRFLLHKPWFTYFIVISIVIKLCLYLFREYYSFQFIYLSLLHILNWFWPTALCRLSNSFEILIHLLRFFFFFLNWVWIHIRLCSEITLGGSRVLYGVLEVDPGLDACKVLATVLSL